MPSPSTRRSLLPAVIAMMLLAAVLTTVATTAAAQPGTPGQQTTVPPTTAPPATPSGPEPRGSRRVATAIDTEKIRATSLPLQAMGIAVAATVGALAICGFVYGRVRSRIPAVVMPRAEAPPSGPPRAHKPAPPLTPGSPLPPPKLPPPTAAGPPTDDTNPWAPPTPD